MPQNCYPVTSGGQSCVRCDVQTFIAAVPAITTSDPNPGWNASATSFGRLSGACYTEFSVPDNVTGVYCGLAPARINNDPRNVNFAFYVYQSNGRELWSIHELGVQKTTPVLRVPATDLFRIERRDGGVTYFFNGRVYYTSLTASVDSLVVVACMYIATDGVN